MRTMRVVAPALAVFIGASLMALGVFAAAPKFGLGYRIICHPGNPAAAVERQFVQDAFLKKTTMWPSGEAIRPVDQAANTAVRRQFSVDVLRRSVDAVRSYWQQRIYSGRELPPPELDRDEAVVQFVLRNRGSIGYVSDGAALDGAKALTVR